MLFPARILAALCLLLCQACSHLAPQASGIPLSAHAFHFGDGGTAGYFVLDKSPDPARPPSSYLFMIPGSDCGSMGSVLPTYFDGLDGRSGGTRIFILHKRFIGAGADGNCSDDFTRADHPGRWLADQEEFIRSELAAARANGHTLKKVAIAGVSEGAEIAPLLALKIPDVTHVALLANGGMDPFDAYRLQMQRLGFSPALADIESLCLTPSDAIIVAERTCRYWKELQAIRHTGNLLALDIPIFIAMGEDDPMVPVESARFIEGKFATQDKRNLLLLTIPGAGHDFRRDGESLLPYLWDAFERWLHQ